MYIETGKDRVIMKRVFALAIILVTMMISACGKAEESHEAASEIASTVPAFAVTSSSVNEKGMLKTKCAAVVAAPKGDNLVPNIRWDKVDGASSYAVYIYDIDAMEFIHLKLVGYNKTEIDEGAFNDEHLYIGPCPPSGTHHYQITVYALKEDVLMADGEVGKSADIAKIEASLDKTSDGSNGNIVAVGVKEFSVKYNERVD